MVASFTDEEPTPMEFRGDGHQPAGQADHWILVGLDFLIPPAKKLDAGVDQQGAKDVYEPMEAVDQGDSGEDEDGAKKKSPDDSPEECGELGAFGNGKVTELNSEDENVVDAEGEFHDVAGEKFHGRANSQREQNQAPKSGGQGDPSGRGLEGSFEVNGSRVAMEKNQVGGQENHKKRTKGDPSKVEILRIHPPYVAGGRGKAKEE